MEKYNKVQFVIDIIRGKNDFLWNNPDEIVNTLAVGDKFIYQGEDANNIIIKHLTSDKPELICRFGTVELGTVWQFFHNRNKKWNFSRGHKANVMYCAGFFPNDDYNMAKFACLQCDIAKNIDILAIRSMKSEIEIAPKYLPDSAEFINIWDYESPYRWKKPWTSYLQGKKVLVIHPFEESIKKQYAKRQLLFKNPNVLPEFDLITFKAVQGAGISSKKLPYNNWFEALEDMKEKISKIDFDIALIGAGAYGMFLGAHCKAMGKKAVHMGGATQLLFGIKGRRWDNSNLYNEHWIRPSAAETPEGVEKLEGGTFAYW